MNIFLILLLAGSMVGISYAREFKSADGSKTVDAEFVRYNPRTGDVTLRMDNGRNMVTKSDFFCDDDREFFKGQYRKEQLKGAISIRSHDKLTRETREKDRLWIGVTTADYIFTIKNESDVDLKHLDVKYWVVIERYNFGKEVNETASGEAAIIELKAEGEEEIKGPHIELTTGATPKATRDENHYNRLLNDAARYGRDRTLGWRVEVYDDDGELILADSSSIRVDRILGVDKKDDDDK